MAKKTRAAGKPWSKEEIKKLKQIFKNRSTRQVAQEMGRSEKAIQGKAAKLGLTKNKGYLKKLGRA